MPRSVPMAIPQTSITDIVNQVWNATTRSLTVSPITAAEIWAYVTRTLTDYSGVWAVATRQITEHEFEQGYSADEVQTTLNTTGSDQSLGSRNITVALPSGMARTRVIALALITIANRTATEQRVDLNLKVGGTSVFSQDSVVHLGAIQGTVVIPIAQDVTAIVTGSGVFACEAEAQIYAAQNVTFTVQYYLFVQYRKS